MTAHLNGEWPGERLRRNLPAIEPLPPDATPTDLARAFADIALVQQNQWPVLVDALDWLRGVVLAARSEAETSRHESEKTRRSVDDLTERLNKAELRLRKVRDKMSSSTDLAAMAQAAQQMEGAAHSVKEAADEITGANMRRPPGLGAVMKTGTDSDRPVTMKDLESRLTQGERDELKKQLRSAGDSLNRWWKVAFMVLATLFTATLAALGYLITHPLH